MPDIIVHGKKIGFPDDHIPGIRVPKGGSSCASCRYLKNDKVSCGNKYFVAWHGSATIPAPIDSYCSDWYEPRKGFSTASTNKE